MEVLLADNLGFCNGVELAMEKAMAALGCTEEGKLFLYGEVVHNSYVTSLFTSRGAKVSVSLEDIPEGATVVVRAHGITDEARSTLLEKNARIVDATCPVVLRNQRLVRESLLPVLVFGDPKHAEVLSLVGAAKGYVKVVAEASDYESVGEGAYRALVQTTFSREKLDQLLSEGRSRGLEIDLVSSICSASIKRRQGVRDLLGKVDAFVVVGDKKSTNTRELVEVARSAGVPAFLVDGICSIPDEIMLYDKIGLTAGASTPKELYERVRQQLKGATYAG